MQDLTLVGLTEDKSRLVLVSDSGEKFTLPADAKLRAALRGDLARHGQLEIRMDSALRPRDIQARIRAGESPESVADAAQTSIDRIMSYATPVLAERAHIAERAQRASVRRKGGEGPARIFGEAVAEQLRGLRVDPGSAEWDSWRREDGRWTVVTTYRSGEHSTTARFVFDVQGRYVVADDDEARSLLGETPTPTAAPRPAAPAGPRRLSSVDWDTSLSLGDDAIEMVTDPVDHPADHPVNHPVDHPADPAGDPAVAPSGAARARDEGPHPDPHEPTVDLTQTARDLRGGTTGRPESLGATADADWMATQATDRPRPLRPLADRSDATSAAAPEEPDDRAHTDTPGRDVAAEQAERAPEAAEPETRQEEKEAPEAAPKKPGRKGRRASVPSWDEIMFGGGRSE